MKNGHKFSRLLPDSCSNWLPDSRPLVGLGNLTIQNLIGIDPVTCTFIFYKATDKLILLVIIEDVFFFFFFAPKHIL